jgi:hypothetical protein
MTVPSASVSAYNDDAGIVANPATLTSCTAAAELAHVGLRQIALRVCVPDTSDAVNVKMALPSTPVVQS